MAGSSYSAIGVLEGDSYHRRQIPLLWWDCKRFTANLNSSRERVRTG
jgi:hypothetical protein